MTRFENIPTEVTPFMQTNLLKIWPHTGMAAAHRKDLPHPSLTTPNYTLINQLYGAVFYFDVYDI